VRDFLEDVLTYAAYSAIAIVIGAIIIFIMLLPIIVNIPWLFVLTIPLALGLATAIIERMQ
jgi:uncharacterized membrane protein YccC